jgi:fructoselysine 6-kinase
VRLACVGDVGVDDYENLGIRRPGGIALNMGVAARAGGLGVSLVSAIGDDSSGEALSWVIAPVGFETGRLRRLPGPTARQAIRLEVNGERRFTGYVPGVLAGWTLDEADRAFLAAHDAVIAPLTDGLEAVFDAVARLPGPARKAADFSVDSDLANGSTLAQSLERYAPAFDVVFVGGTPDHLELIEDLGKHYPECVFVLTLGADGALAFHRGAMYRQSAIPLDLVVDTTGCGDAFQGAFLARYLRHGSLQDALRSGAERAAVTAVHLGATAPMLPMLESFGRDR